MRGQQHQLGEATTRLLSAKQELVVREAPTHNAYEDLDILTGPPTDGAAVSSLQPPGSAQSSVQGMVAQQTAPIKRRIEMIANTMQQFMAMQTGTFSARGNAHGTATVLGHGHSISSPTEVSSRLPQVRRILHILPSTAKLLEILQQTPQLELWCRQRGLRHMLVTSRS